MFRNISVVSACGYDGLQLISIIKYHHALIYFRNISVVSACGYDGLQLISIIIYHALLYSLRYYQLIAQQ